MQIHVGAIVQRCTVGVQLDLIGQKTGGFVKSTALANNSARNCFGKGGIADLFAFALERCMVRKLCGIVLVPDVMTGSIQRGVVGDKDMALDFFLTIVCIAECLRRHGNDHLGRAVCQLVYSNCIRGSGRGSAIAVDFNAVFVQNQTLGYGIGNDPFIVIDPFENSFFVDLNRPRQLCAGLQGSAAVAVLNIIPIKLTGILVEVLNHVGGFVDLLLSRYSAAVVDVADVFYSCTAAGQGIDLDFCCVGDGQRAGHTGAFEVDRKQTQIFAIVIFFAGISPFCDLHTLGDVVAVFVCYLDRAKINLLCLVVLFGIIIPERTAIIVVNIAVDVFRVDGALPLQGGCCTIIGRLANCLFGKNIRVDVDSTFRAAVQPIALQIAGVFDIQTGQRDSFCDPCLVGDLILVEAFRKLVGEGLVCAVVDI